MTILNDLIAPPQQDTIIMLEDEENLRMLMRETFKRFLPGIIAAEGLPEDLPIKFITFGTVTDLFLYPDWFPGTEALSQIAAESRQDSLIERIAQRTLGLMPDASMRDEPSLDEVVRNTVNSVMPISISRLIRLKQIELGLKPANIVIFSGTNLEIPLQEGEVFQSKVEFEIPKVREVFKLLIGINV